MRSLSSFLRGVLAVLFVGALACGPSAPKGAAPTGTRCDDAAGCERAVLAASDEALPKVLARLEAVTGDGALGRLYDALRASPARTVVLGAAPSDVGADDLGGAAVGHAPLPGASVAVPLDALLVRLGRATGKSHVLVLGDDPRQLFPVDGLAPHMLGLAPRVALAPKAAGQAIAIATKLEPAVSAAATFDYVKAATSAVALRELVATVPVANEGAMRARFGLWLLGSAGITLASADDAAAPTPSASFPARQSSPYAELLAVHLSRPAHAAAWRAREQRIVTGMSADRVAALRRLYAEEDSCPGPLAPPIEHPADVAFASLLALSLDTEAAPDAAPAAGKLPLSEWLERYEKLVVLVEQSGTTWAALTSLLRQRGELYGITAEGSAAYQRVTQLALKHVNALAALAAAHPDGFEPLAVVTLSHQPGALTDGRLRPALTKLIAGSVSHKIAAAADTSALFDAALAAFAGGMSAPAALQQPQLEALVTALEAKLGGAFGRGTGWGMAGLHAAQAVLATLLGADGAIATGADRVADALADADTGPDRSLARLTASAARYAAISDGDALDPDVSNPALFTPARTRARKDLGAAIDALAEPGPTTPAERDLARALAELGDALVVASVAHVTAEAQGPQCSGQSAIGQGSALRDAFDRLRKQQKTLLALHAFGKGDALWTRRARLFGLLLSDVIDFLDQPGGTLAFRIDGARAAELVNAGLDGWLDASARELAAGVYLLLRSGLDPSNETGTGAAARRTIAALGAIFGSEEGSLFGTLGKLTDEVAIGEDTPIVALITSYARKAYQAKAHDHGDLLLLAGFTAAVVREEDVDADAIALARDEGRPVYLPLVLHGPRTKTRARELAAAMRKATLVGCNPPSPEALLTVQKAIDDFQQNRRDAAITGLGALLDQAERDGFAVPRQVLRFEQQQGTKVFKIEQSISFGTELLRNAQTFQVGFGYNSESATEGRLTVEIADHQSRAAHEEAARYFAHAALIHAVHAFVHGKDEVAIGAARRAIGAWIAGTRLGKIPVYVGADSASWARDATATLLVAGQLAADRGFAFLAGDLFTLAKTSLDPAAADADIDALLEPLPSALSGIPELGGPVATAKKTATLLAMGHPCTHKDGDLAAWVRVSCEQYPTAIALRATDALKVLPRLGKQGQGQGCVALGHLDGFFAAADQGRYEPAALLAAVESLHQAGRHNDAASVLTRHRHPDHCNPKLVTLARKLAARTELGTHLRADLHGVATNCSPPDEVDADLLALDALTEGHALPTRNFEVLLFATRLALKHNRWEALASITARPGFIQRHNALGPELGTAALLVEHAAAIGAGKPLALDKSLPFYRLLCTTFPPKERSSMCHAITLMRSEGSAADKKRVAATTLAEFLQRAASTLQGSTP